MDNIDKIIYINLEKRIDRKIDIENQLKHIQLPYERFEAIYTQPGYIGCGLSHIGALKRAKQLNLKNVLICEDDIIFLTTKEILNEYLQQFFDFNIKWDVIQLAYNVRKDIILDNTIINKIVNSATASCYLVNGHYIQILIDLFEKNIPLLAITREHWKYSIDMCWYSLQEKDNWFYFKNRLAKQNNGWSDICNEIVIRDC